MRIARAALLFSFLAGIGPIAAQAQWDNSGNTLLNNAYYFRQVIYVPSDANGDISRAISIYGNITFTGASGTYTISNAMVNDSSASQILPIACYLGIGSTSTCSTATVSGTYTIAASGYGFFTSPVSTLTSNGDSIYGTVSNGILIGSSTETADGYNDLFIAAPVGAATPNFSGTYTMAGYLLGTGGAASPADVFFQISPSGGNLGTVNITGYTANGSTAVTTLSQSSSGVKYTTGNGAAIITYPNNANAPFFEGSPTTEGPYTSSTYGPEYLYFSPDGSFCFGGSPYDWDMVVGVRSDSSTFNSGVIYYNAGLDLDDSTLASGYATADSFHGSFSSTAGSIIEADRILTPGSSVYADTYGDTTTDTTYAQYAFANGGAVRIGAGVGPYLGLSVAVQAPKSPGSSGYSVYFDPTSLQNAGSYAPFTSGVSPGELVTLYGTNLANGFAQAPAGAFPKSLGGVQVSINNTPAPIYYVSSSQISFIVPYEVSGSVAAIQVVNGTTASNQITAFLYETSVGSFTQYQQGQAPGLGYASAVHNATGLVVTPSNPAQPGEYIQLFVTGLGTIYPTVTDGAVGPSGPLSASTYCLIPTSTQCEMTVSVNGVAAPLQFVGLAPTLAGLYQINFQVPTSGLTTGDQPLQICGPDSCTSEALITIGGSIVPLAVESHNLPRKVRPAIRAETATGGLQKSKAIGTGVPVLSNRLSHLP
jgi:uncharacterized protein (TIGR03437 family)